MLVGVSVGGFTTDKYVSRDWNVPTPTPRTLFCGTSAVRRKVQHPDSDIGIPKAASCPGDQVDTIPVISDRDKKEIERSDEGPTTPSTSATATPSRKNSTRTFPRPCRNSIPTTSRGFPPSSITPCSGSDQNSVNARALSIRTTPNISCGFEGWICPASPPRTVNDRPLSRSNSIEFGPPPGGTNNTARVADGDPSSPPPWGRLINSQPAGWEFTRHWPSRSESGMPVGSCAPTAVGTRTRIATRRAISRTRNFFILLLLRAFIWAPSPSQWVSMFSVNNSFLQRRTADVNLDPLSTSNLLKLESDSGSRKHL